MSVPKDTPLEAKERLNLMTVMDVGDYKIPKRSCCAHLIA